MLEMLRSGFLFALAFFVLALLFHVALPDWPIKLTGALIFIEVISVLFWVYSQMRWGTRTDLEILLLFPLLPAILIGNVAAVPIARVIRSKSSF